MKREEWRTTTKRGNEGKCYGDGDDGGGEEEKEKEERKMVSDG